MPGILGIISNHEKLTEIEIDYLSLAPFDCCKKSFENLRFERFTNPKFLDDKVFEEDDDLLIGIEGIIFNYADLRAKYKSENNFSLVKKMYEESENSFFNDFRGEFSGFVYNKKKNTVHVFTNHTSSKNIYFYYDSDVFIFASEVKIITQALKKLGKNSSLNETGAYFLLTYGFMLHDHTLVKNVKKLLPGHYIKINLAQESDGKISFKHIIDPYFHFTNSEITGESKSEIIEKIDEKFRHAVMQEYKKDVEYGFRHIATLSGGLDSRMGVLMADKLGFNDITTMTFSESDYYDEKIARKIAREHGFEYLFMSLDHGNYLKDVDSPVICNDGNVFYAGAAHHLRMTSFFNHKDF